LDWFKEKFIIFAQDTLKNKNLVRILMVFTIIYYTPLFNLVFSFMNRPASGIIYAMEDGMGGALIPESSFSVEFDEYDNDPEIWGMPEPEDYSRPQMLTFGSYTLQGGDIIGRIAVMTGLNEDTLISVNNINNTRLLQIGQALRIPNQDGIYHDIRQGESLESIAEQYRISAEQIVIANEIFSDNITPGLRIFIPDGRMDWVRRQEINGDLFLWPSSGHISSPYGWRLDPFGSGLRQFHTGIDIANSIGTPVLAAMSGRIAHVGYDSVYGNYIIINHHSGYRTLYAHLSTVRVRAGTYVTTGQRIADVGVSGRVTGPHLHFTVYKDGVTVNPRSLMR